MNTGKLPPSQSAFILCCDRSNGLVDKNNQFDLFPRGAKLTRLKANYAAFLDSHNFSNSPYHISDLL